MANPHVKTNWQNEKAPSINAANLLNMENQYDEVMDLLPIIVKNKGAMGNATIDDVGAISDSITASAGRGICFSAGTYVIGSNLTISQDVPVWFLPGAKLSINNGVTVTINGPINAGHYQIFLYNGTGKAVIKDYGFVSAEWFPGTDIGAKINAAFDAIYAGGGGGIVRLPAGKSYTFSTPIAFGGTSGNRHGLYLEGESYPNYGVGENSFGTHLFYSGTGFAITFFNVKDCGISKIRLTGTLLQAGTPTVGRHGIWIYSDNVTTTHRIKVEDVIIRHFDIGLRLGDTSNHDGTGTQYQSDYCDFKNLMISSGYTGIEIMSNNTDGSVFDGLWMDNRDYNIKLTASGFLTFKNIMFSSAYTPDPGYPINFYFPTNNYGRTYIEDVQTENAATTYMLKMDAGGQALPIEIVHSAWSNIIEIGPAAATHVSPISIKYCNFSGTVNLKANGSSVLVERSVIEATTVFNLTGSSTRLKMLANYDKGATINAYGLGGSAADSFVHYLDGYHAVTTWDPPSLADGAVASTTVTVGGVAIGDVALAGLSSIGANNVVLSAHVESANTVRVVLRNVSGGVLDIPSGTLTVHIWKH